MATNPKYFQPQAESQFVENLRARYEEAGFTFTVHPMGAHLPDFLGSYRPDALAQKPGHNVVIEVKRRQDPSTERQLTNIRRLFVGHPDWQFHAVFMGADPQESVTIPASAPVSVRGRMEEVRSLIAQGHRRSAFVVAWSLLEAALRALNGETGSQPRTPGTLVQTLATNGYIEPDTERRMRALVEVRNRIVHGDLEAEPATADIESVLSAIDETLNAGAS